jgi:hypothetical protein
MQRLISWLIRIAFVLVLLGASSFAAAQFKARQLVGPRAPVREPATTLAWKGVQDLPGKPRAWVVTYSQIRLADVRRVRIVVSLTGRVLSVAPPDLEARLEEYRRSLEP